MSRLQTSYCSCSTCTQLRNEQPKYYRYVHSLREIFFCKFCFPNRRIISKENFDKIEENRRSSTISFRDIDITHKHCSKHDVMVKASRPQLSKLQNDELRQRVKDANQRWTRMSILPSTLIEFTFDRKDSLPLCSDCYENLSTMTFNLCHNCIRNLIQMKSRFQTEPLSISIINEETKILSIDDDDRTQNISIGFYPSESDI